MKQILIGGRYQLAADGRKVPVIVRRQERRFLHRGLRTTSVEQFLVELQDGTCRWTTASALER